MKNEYRYPGAQPFTAEDKKIFFGREKDIELLVERIRMEKLIVLHSQSGLGKSSLINAGVNPVLKEEGLYDSISIRFGSDMSDKEESPVDISLSFIKANNQESTFLDKLLPEENSFWFHVKKRQIKNPSEKNFFLVFDQFEELFTYSKKSIHDFAYQLTELLHTQTPQRVIEAVYKDKNLTTKEKELLNSPLKIRVMLAVRSDRLHLLDSLSNDIPGILNQCYELKALNKIQAEDAILNPAFDQNPSFLSPTFDFENEALEMILDFLTEDGKHKIESFQLQIICQFVERKVIKDKLKLVSIKDLGDLEEVFENYYNDQIELLDSPKEKAIARAFIEDGLVFEEDRRRLSLYEGQIHKVFGISPELLAQLVDTHLLRAEVSPKGGYTYELSHDTLIDPVLRSKSIRKAKEKAAAEEALRLEREEALAEEKAKRVKAVRIATLGFALAAISILAMITSLFFYNRAKSSELKLSESNEVLQKTNIDLSLTRDNLEKQNQLNQELLTQIEAQGKFAVIIAYDRNRAEADYELHLVTDRLGIDNATLISYNSRWYTAVVYKNAKEAFSNLEPLKAKMGTLAARKDMWELLG